MAINTNEQRTPEITSGRKWAIGTNVFLSIVIAAALLVAVNYLSSVKYARKDVAELGQFGLSERSQRILDQADEDINLSLLYTPNPADEKQQEYIERLHDYCDELRRFDDKIHITHIATDNQREKLVHRITGTFGKEAEQHKTALSSWDRLRTDLETDIQQRLNEANVVVSNEGWLADFPLFGSVVTTLKTDLDLLAKASEEIKELTPDNGIPKYADASAKAASTLSAVRVHITAITDRLAELATLADETGREDSVNIKMLREAAEQIRASGQSLRAIIGEPDTPMPEDIPATLKAFADQSLSVGKGLESLAVRVDEFATRFPMVRQHQDWSANMQNGPFTVQLEVAGVFDQVSKTLQKVRLFLLGVIDSGDPAQLEEALKNIRLDVGALENNTTVCEELLTDLATRLSHVDEGSSALMSMARQGTLFGDRIAAIETLEKEIGELPELKLGNVADQLREDNTIVVETGDDLRVLGFSEVFPPRQSIAGPGGAEEDLGRAFNGDSVIASAVLSLTQERPFATVIFVSFEPPPPAQRNQFTPPPSSSSIPTRALSILRTRLEDANFKVVDWNLATTPEAPKPDEGTEPLYVCLPPAPPAMPSPFGQPAQSPVFGDKERQIIRDLLATGARMLFLATWEVRGGGFMGGPPRTPPYGYAPLLSQDWGLDVETGRRITWVIPDRQTADTFTVVPRRFDYMPVNGFTDHAIGDPLKGTRFLIYHACPIHIAEKPPENVTTSVVLQIPKRENYIGPSLDELISIIDKLNSRTTDGKITLTPYPQLGPFDLMVTATRTTTPDEGEKPVTSQIVVCGFGSSVTDGYLQSPVPVEGEVFRLDPPPTENADLIVNALYWLQGLEQYAARGPVPVPRVEAIASKDWAMLQALVYAILPILVLTPGVLLWYIRRR